MVPKERMYRVLVHAQATVELMLRQLPYLPADDPRAAQPRAESLLGLLRELETDCRVARRALEPIASHKE